ncbi:MAG: DUF2851 family protein [Flavobacteriaceae bacterium]|nr:DUF2851 family protein [Flavobacteriaceae bacterium]
MKEDFLHYLWKFQKFSTVNLFTTDEKPSKVLKVGVHNHHAGPDFLMAQIEIDGQLWVGNVEIHVKSSDWYVHQHEKDAHYDNVILHVVWEHDAPIFRSDNSVLQTLEIKEIVEKKTVQKYYQLFSENRQFISCEKTFGSVDDFIFQSWLWRLFVERLERKSEAILQELKLSQNNWEAVLFTILSKNFGLTLNGDSFYSVAKSVDYSLIKKCGGNVLKLEAILFGQAGMLETEKMGRYFSMLKDSYEYSKTMYKISNEGVISSKFFRLRPPNFPTIRLSQLAVLWTSRPHIFSEIMEAKSKETYYGLFNIAASEYWDTHYNFEISSSKRKKSITKGFIDLLLINTIIPLKFAYATQQGQDMTEELIDLALSLPVENNSIISKFQSLRSIENSAWHSQSLLQLKNEYCSKQRCMQCELGNFILKY